MIAEMLTEAIRELLAASDAPLTAKEITHRLRRKRLGVTKSDVNPRLYQGLRNGWFIRQDTNGAPLWSVRTLSPQVLVPLPASGQALDLRLYPWQGEAMLAWHQANRRGIVEAVTGSGKTRLGITIAYEHVARANGKVAIIVPSLIIQEQWIDELNGHTPSLRVGMWKSGVKDSFNRLDVLVATAQTGYKELLVTDEIARTGAGPLLIADEVHHYAAPMWRASLEETFPFRLGLTATHHELGTAERDTLDAYFSGVCFSYGYEQAIPDGVIAPFRLATCGVDFASSLERARYETADEEARSSRRELINRFGYPSDPREFIRHAQERAAEGGSDRDILLARRYLRAFTERRRLLAETATKLDALEALAEAMEWSDRTIVFTETKEAAHAAAAKVEGLGLEAQAMTADTLEPEREQIKRKFADGLVQVLCGPKLLDEGMDIPAADLGIILAASKTRRQMIQRMGRVLRPKQGDANAALVIMYVAGTNEDPAGGAHEAFFGIIANVADALCDFPVGNDLSSLPAFLFPDK